MAESETQASIADSVVVSHDGDDATESSLMKHAYVRYLQRSKAGVVTEGEVWDEFVNCGCGTTEDVRLRVEAVVGGSAIGDDTTFRFERR